MSSPSFDTWMKRSDRAISVGNWVLAAVPVALAVDVGMAGRPGWPLPRGFGLTILTANAATLCYVVATSMSNRATACLLDNK